MFNLKGLEKLSKFTLFLFLAWVLLSCSSSPSATFTPLIDETTVIAPTLTYQLTNPTDESDVIIKNCLVQEQASNIEASLNGRLLFGNIREIHFPDLAEHSFLSSSDRIFSDSIVSSDGKFLVTGTVLYDVAGDYLGKTLDVYSSNGEIVASIEWNEERWSFIRGWAGDKVVIQTKQANLLVVLNPFLETSHKLNLSHVGDGEISIIAYDPFLRFIAYYYLNDSGTKIRMIIWDLINQKEIWSTKNLYYPMISDIVWSHDGSKVAISTLPLNDIENHSEIVIVDRTGQTTSVSNLKRFFQQIQIIDIQWSLNNSKIFFWAWTRDKNTITESNYGLYDIDVNTGTVTEHCVTGDDNNDIVFFADNPGYFVIKNFTTNDSNNGTYKWDVLLVDLETNKTYKIGEDFSPFGWMPLP